MSPRGKYSIIFGAALVCGIFLASGERISAQAVNQNLRAQKLTITRANGSDAIIMGTTNAGEAAMWLYDGAKRGTINMGVHSNGYPFVLVSDGAVRNFGLGRVDGTQASPILVFRSKDIVRMVLGLSMTEKNQSPFWVHYSGDNKKHLYFGDYCDAPSRACL